MKKIANCLVESVVFCHVLLCSNVFAVNYPINPPHKILEKFLNVTLIVYFNLGKFGSIRCVLSTLSRLTLRVHKNRRRNPDSVALSVNFTKIRILGRLG